MASIITEAAVTAAASATKPSPRKVMVRVRRADSQPISPSPAETQMTPAAPARRGASPNSGTAASTRTTGMSPRIIGKATAKSPSR
ncbi:MAG TPA: hypothetical protein VKA80_12270 [Beijerinckiaceae bacterium]|nr:hypothetical protein [Beijerinckiaceae bacterium]